MQGIGMGSRVVLKRGLLGRAFNLPDFFLRIRGKNLGA